jgi:putative ABC transport system permease protein
MTMNLASLTLVNLGRNKRRTILTLLSVAVALFLYCALSGVLDTLDEATHVGSENRMVVRNAISLVFPLPLSMEARLAAMPEVRSVAMQNWFGGQDPKDPHNFFAQFGVESETFFPMYGNEIEITEASPPQATVALPAGMDPKLAAFMGEQTACVVGSDLMTKNGWKVGQTIHLSGTISPGDWPFTIRAVYHSKVKAFGNEVLFFHWKYLYEKTSQQALAGLYKVQLKDPGQASEFAHQVDEMFVNSDYATHTETERAFAAGFISMYGNLPFVLKVIGLAVVFAILLIAANTMVMAVRERTSETGVLKTLGFTDASIFVMVLAEAISISLLGGLIGAFGARKLVSGFNMGGLLPPMTVRWSTVWTGVAVALLVGAISGWIPAWQASRLRIVNALRRVD